MTNEQLVLIRQLAVLGLLATAICVMMFYVYWQQTKSIIKMFKELPLVAFIISIFWPHDKD